ncbi:POK18 protein, partial [Ciccaba nigrolineata]|nr:POK18 protein [Ciccaba nigrolineata]
IRYLGMEVTESIVRPQNLKINVEISTLFQAQQLLGSLQWIRPLCGITNEDIEPLVSLLKGGGSPEER